MPIGLYRIPMGWGDQHSVLVDYGSERLEISESRYRENGYRPRFDELPWQDEDERAQDA